MKSGRARAVAVALALAAVTLLAFAGVLRNGFISLDDPDYLTDNPVVRRGLSLPGAAWAFTTTHQANWHPLTWLSHMLDVSLFGLDPGAHHLVSLAIHVASSLLLLLALWRLTGALWPGALVAALFALHPLHVESVAWAAERKDVLSTLLALAALLAYVRAARRGTVARSVAVPALFALALLAKPMPLTLPLLLLVLDWWPLGRWAAGRRQALWTEKIPLFLLTAASAGITLFAQARGGAVVSQAMLPLPVRAANAVLSYAGYLAKAVWPADLAVFYPHPTRLPPWHLLAGSLAVLAALSLLAARNAGRRPWLAAGWLWFAGTLVPVIGLVQAGSQGMADRYTYLPLTGIFVAAAWSLAAVAGSRPGTRAAAALCCAAALAALASLTHRQVALWRDTPTLFNQALSVSGESAAAHNGIGVWHFSEGRYGQALGHFREAARLAPWSAEMAFNRATALEGLGNLTEAEASYRRAVELAPNHPRAWNNLGIVLGKLKRGAEAEGAYRRALAIDPRLAEADFNLGVLLASRGRLEEAAARYRTALEIEPGSFHAHTNLGVLLAGQGRYREALGHFRAAVEREPGDAAALRNLGNVLLALGDRDGAAAAFREAGDQDVAPAAPGVRP